MAAMQGFPGPLPDMEQLQSSLFAMEHVCSRSQMFGNMEEAEKVIFSLMGSPMPYQTCRFILETSRVSEAKFQATAAIIVAAIREWGILTDENKKSLIMFCLQYVMEHVNDVDSYVTVKVSSVAAQMLKRGWLEFAEADKVALLVEVKQAILWSHALDVKLAGICFLESLVSEFSSLTSTSMGLPRDFHDQCRSSLESNYLKEFYCWAHSAAMAVTDRIVGCHASATENKICSTALRFMFQILNWNFGGNNGAIDPSVSKQNSWSTGIRHDTVMLQKFERSLVLPGPAWHDVLLSSGQTLWLLNLYGTLRQTYSSDVIWFDSPLATSARQLIVQLCSLAGDVFPSDNGEMQVKHLVQILAAVVQWMEQSDVMSITVACRRSESEIIDGCHVLLSMATLTSTTLFDNLLRYARPVGTIHLLSSITSDVVKAHASNNDEETWTSDALDILLETWTVILSRTGSDNLISTEGVSAVSDLFQTIVETHLKAAADSAFEDDCQDDYFHVSVSKRDETMSAYALIARVAVNKTVPFLTRLFSTRFVLLSQSGGKTDFTQTQEELYWLLLMTGHVLTDSGEGETMLVEELEDGNDKKVEIEEVESSSDRKDYALELEAFGTLCGETDTEALRLLLQKISSAESDIRPIVLSPDSDKSHRAEVHNFFKKHFKFLVTDTVEESGAKSVRVRNTGVGEIKGSQGRKRKDRKDDRPFDSRGSENWPESRGKFLRTILGFVRQCLEPERRNTYFSPRLMEAFVWFLARWVDTYLMPVDSAKGQLTTPEHENGQVSEFSKELLLKFAGQNDQGKLLLDTIVRISMTTLTSYHGENELHALTCQKLLGALVHRKHVCAHLVAFDLWSDLARAFVNERTLFSIIPHLQRSLAEILVCAASSIKDVEASNQYVRDLMVPMTSYLLDISQRSDLKALAQQADMIYMISCLLERLRGACRAGEPRTQKSIFEMGSSIMNSLLIFLEVYKNQSTVVYLILKFVVEFVEGEIIFLNAKETSTLVNFCLQLLQIYSSHNIGKISLSLSSSLQSEAQTEKYKDLRALLHLLRNICSKDLVDFSSISEEADCPDISEVIYVGLHIVTPLISLDLLKYPKLCRDYFALVAHLLEVYPEKVVHLNKEAFEHIIKSLNFGCHHQDTDIVDKCLITVSALASFHYKERIVGKEGLSAKAIDSELSRGGSHESVLSYFLRLVLALLFKNFRMELSGSAADALLPLVLCDQDSYQQMVQNFLERQTNPALRERLANAFHTLTSAALLSPSLDRPARVRFRKSLQAFLIEISGFMTIV